MFIGPISHLYLFCVIVTFCYIIENAFLGIKKTRSIIDIGASLVRKLCADHSLNLTQFNLLTDDGKKLINHLIIDDDHQLIYCFVPKVACTSWKKLLVSSILFECNKYI